MEQEMGGQIGVAAAVIRSGSWPYEHGESKSLYPSYLEDSAEVAEASLLDAPWMSYQSWLAWQHLGLHPADQEEVSGEE